MLNYIITINTIENQDIKNQVVYGAEVYTIREGKKIILDSINDVFINRKQAEEFVKLCNENNLSIVHFRDAVQDTVESIYSH